MKRNYIVKLLIILITIALASCNNKENRKSTSHQHDQIRQEYTCPMHPQIVQDKPGQCPICGMDLVPRHANTDQIDTSLAYSLKPVNEQVIATIQTVIPQQGSKVYITEVQGRITYDTRNQTSISSRVSGRIERLYIKYNYQPIRKGQLIMEIYSPDFAAAQRELLYINQTSNEENMLQLAKQRLLLLGMSAQQISQVLKTRRIIYNVPVFSNAAGYILEKSAAVSTTIPSSNTSGVTSSGGGMDNMRGNSSINNTMSGTASASPSPVLIREGQYVGAGQSIFTIYQTNNLVAEFSLNPQIAGRIKKSEKIVIRRTANKEETFTGTIGLIQPVLNEGRNFIQARVFLTKAGLKVGELIVGQIPIIADKGWWLPEEAILSLGNRFVVFKKEGRVFVPKIVTVGASTNNQVQVLDNINNWSIASNAYYLVDSESFIRIQNNKAE